MWSGAASQGINDRIERLQQIRVMCGAIEGLMELGVDNDVLLGVLLTRSVGNDLEQALYFRLGGVLGCERGRGAFQHLTDGVELHELFRLELRDPHAVPRATGPLDLRG